MLRKKHGICRFWPVVAGLSLGLLSGCDSGHERYKPTSGEARSSLEAALSAWRDGKPVGPIDAKPPVHVVDSVWGRGQKIESFQIGEEQDGGDGTKQFPVKLTMKPKGGEQDVKYVVHGRDPVYVFREEDYLRTLNMENNPESRPSGSRSNRSRR
jgi:hypothetical protein